MSFINLSGHVKRSFEKILRQAFSSEFAPDIYKYSEDKKASQIAIYRDNPRAPEKYPCITIEVSSGSMDMTTLGNEGLETVLDENGAIKEVIASGQLDVDVSVTVMAETQDDRENIVDLLTIFLRSILRNAFAEENIAYNRIEFTGESDELGPLGETRFSAGIRIPGCFVIWESKIRLGGAIIENENVTIEAVEVDVSEE